NLDALPAHPPRDRLAPLVRLEGGGCDRLARAEGDREPQPAQRLRPVLMLRTRLDRDRLEPGRSVAEADGGLRLVSLLASGPARAEPVHLALREKILVAEVQEGAPAGSLGDGVSHLRTIACRESSVPSRGANLHCTMSRQHEPL